MICNSLSRSGFEVEIIDHTGMNIRAYNPKMEKRIGITARSRIRGERKRGSSQSESVEIF